MESFYGGPKGQDFIVKEIFSTKAELDKDLAKSWTSPISIGDYVVVSYGLTSDSSYTDYLESDFDTYGQTYNATLWRKTYTEDGTGSAAGLAYELVTSMSGATATITIADTVVLDADQEPYVEQEESRTDLSILTFYLPQSQVIETATVTVLDADENPAVSLDTTDINKPILNFSLPVAQLLQQGTTTVLDADESPSFSIDFSNINKPVISFSLPQSQVMADPTTTVVGPSEDPSVTLGGTVNAPKLLFNLPSAIRFYTGTLLGEKSAGTYTITNSAFSSYNVGDYYINSDTGFIYEVTAVSGTTCTFKYVACLSAPTPSVTTASLSPYTESNGTYIPTTPAVTKEYTDEEETSWLLTFSLPSQPTFSASFNFVGVDGTGSVVAETTSETNVNLEFTIPRGSKIFTGTSAPSSVSGSLVGDIYLDTSTGYVYTLTSSGWSQADGTLQGPVGNSLNVVATYTIDEADGYTNSLADGVTYIEANYTGTITSGDLFGVIWIDADTDEETSYWYYQMSDGTWAKLQLTGGVDNFIKNEYNDESDGDVTDRTYSIHYLNSVIGSLTWGTFSDLIDGSSDDSGDDDDQDTEETLVYDGTNVSENAVMEITLDGGDLT